MAQRRLEHPGRYVDDWHHPVVGHARRADDPEDTDRVVVDVVRRRHDAAGVEYSVARLFADEDLDTVGVDAAVQQVEDQTLAREGIKEPPQRVDIGELREVQEPPLPGENIVLIRLLSVFHRRVGDRDDVVHGLVHRVACFVEILDQPGPQRLQIHPGVMLVDKVLGLLQLGS